MEIENIIENYINKYTFNNKRSFISVGNIKRDFSMDNSNEKKMMINYILTGKCKYYIVPITQKTTYNLVFDIDNSSKYNIKHQLSKDEFFKLIIGVILETLKNYFKDIDKFEYIVCTHTLNNYKYHITFPNIKVNCTQGCEINNLIINNEKLNFYYSMETLNHIIDQTLYKYTYMGLAFPYQEKTRGSGYYCIDPNLSTFDIAPYDIYKLMYMCSKKGTR